MKELGRIPDGGGWRVRGRPASRMSKTGVGFDYVHSAVDDHSRLAYSEVHADEKAATCVAFLRRAAAFFATCGIDRIERILTDNAWAYRKSLAWQQALADLGAVGKLTRAYRPQTNGKVERFNRTLLEEWAHLRPYTSNTERTAALDNFLHQYNHHQSHTALGGKPPISRANNAAGQYTQSHAAGARAPVSRAWPYGTASVSGGKASRCAANTACWGAPRPFRAVARGAARRHRSGREVSRSSHCLAVGGA